MIEAIAGGFVTLQSRLRHEAAHRSTNISIIQTYREMYSQNQSDRQWAWGVAEKLSANTGLCGLSQTP